MYSPRTDDIQVFLHERIGVQFKVNYKLNSSVRLTIKCFLLVVMSSILGACGTTSSPLGQAVPNDPVRAAQHNLERGHYARAAELYASAAHRLSNSADSNALHLKAALAALQAENADMAARELSTINPSKLGSAYEQRYQLAQILVHNASLPPAQQLERLPPPASNTPADLAAYIWNTRARLLFEQYRYIAGIHNLVQRSAWLTDKQAAKYNNRLIFKRALEAVEVGRGSDNPLARQIDSTTLGWLRLAEIKKHAPPGSGPALHEALTQWESRFRGHPATRDVLPRIFDYKPFSTPNAYAHTNKTLGTGPIMLALPLSGKLAMPAQAIRAGFNMARNSDATTNRRLIVVDTTNMDASDIIQQARTKAVALIVGPLIKGKVTSLAQLAPRVPVLALNQIQGTTAPPSFYRYALAPEDDARTAAKHAAALGWHNALVLAPDGEWGSRVLHAFQDAFVKHGGTVVDYASFDTTKFNHKNAVKSVLKSYQNGMPVDFVFMAARPVHARLLRSQLRFYHAAKLPVIATSDAYTGHPEPRKDSDLNGVSFTALPWVISLSPRIRAAREHALKLGTTATKRFPRLFAMGIDAWRLTDAWIHGGLASGATVPGTTGLLEITATGRVQRHLAWAQFVDGYAKLLEPVLPNAPKPLNGASAARSNHNAPAPAAPVADAAASTPIPASRPNPQHASSAAAPKEDEPEISPLIDLSDPNAESTSDRGIVYSESDEVQQTPPSNNGSIYPDTSGQPSEPLLY